MPRFRSPHLISLNLQNHEEVKNGGLPEIKKPVEPPPPSHFHEKDEGGGGEEAALFPGIENVFGLEKAIQ